ncbi:hypothetical protein AAIB46_10060 [Streptomyces sp. 35M1]|uniref:hypothetical protein n=1 Tax=Streptomyces sp. 35M1 TaxID=3142978 RepID=UPI00399059F6
MPDIPSTPLRVRAIPGGSRLALDAFAQTVIESVLDELLTPDRDSDLYDRLTQLADLTPAERAQLPEHRLPYEELVADLMDRAPKWAVLSGGAGTALAAQLAVNDVRAQPAGRWVAEAWRAWLSRKPSALNGGAAA